VPSGERGSGIPRAQTATLERIRQTLEDAGVEFLGNGPPGAPEAALSLRGGSDQLNAFDR
jgi:hypothetical protein